MSSRSTFIFNEAPSAEPQIVSLTRDLRRVHAALHSPQSFAALILVEPLLANPATNVHRPYEIVSAAAANRRDVFDTRYVVAFSALSVLSFRPTINC